MWVAKGVEKFVSVSMEQITKTNDRAWTTAPHKQPIFVFKSSNFDEILRGG